jgi:uncharacterized protein (DUF302 family)
MISTSRDGIVHLLSVRTVDQVLEHLLSLLSEKSITVFAVVDHSGEAARVGLEMRATKLVIFGNPKAGTPLMLAEPDSALDLPLKLLIAQAANGTTSVSYNSIEYLASRFALSADVISHIAVIEQIAAEIANSNCCLDMA